MAWHVVILSTCALEMYKTFTKTFFTKIYLLQVTSRDKEIHEREEELKKVQDMHSKDKQTMEEIEAQLKKTSDERAVLAEQIFREKEMAAEADDVSFRSCRVLADILID